MGRWQDLRRLPSDRAAFCNRCGSIRFGLDSPEVVEQKLQSIEFTANLSLEILWQRATIASSQFIRQPPTIPTQGLIVGYPLAEQQALDAIDVTNTLIGDVCSSERRDDLFLQVGTQAIAQTRGSFRLYASSARTSASPSILRSYQSWRPPASARGGDRGRTRDIAFNTLRCGSRTVETSLLNDRHRMGLSGPEPHLLLKPQRRSSSPSILPPGNACFDIFSAARSKETKIPRGSVRTVAGASVLSAALALFASRVELRRPISCPSGRPRVHPNDLAAGTSWLRSDTPSLGGRPHPTARPARYPSLHLMRPSNFNASAGAVEKVARIVARIRRRRRTRISASAVSHHRAIPTGC